MKISYQLWPLLLFMPLHAVEVIKEKIEIDVMSLNEWLESPVAKVDIVRNHDGSGYGWKLGDMKKILDVSGCRNLAQSLEHAKHLIEQKDPEGYYLYSLHLRHAIGVDFNVDTLRSYLSLAANAGHVRAQFDLACLYFAQGETTKGFEFLTKAAEQNLPEAQYALALGCLNPKDPERFNLERALSLLAQAAEQGYLNAQLSLAQLYLEGELVKRDEAQVYHYLCLAAKHDDLYAVSTLSIMERLGLGTTSDAAKIQAWDAQIKAIEEKEEGQLDAFYEIYRQTSLIAQRLIVDKAEMLSVLQVQAAFGDEETLYLLGLCHALGIAPSKESAVDVSYMEESAKAGYLKAQLWLADYYQQRAYNYNTLRMGELWGVRAAKSGDAYAQAAIGRFYMGDEADLNDHKNYKKAAYWLGQAVKQNEKDALSDLAYLYERGWGVEKDLMKSRELYTRAAKMDSALALRKLAELSEKAAKDFPKGSEDRKKLMLESVGFDKQAADLGDVTSQTRLGKVLLDGYEILQDEQEAVYYLELATEGGNHDAATYLAGSYYSYLGKNDGTKDLRKAFYLYLKASASGSALASYALGHIFTKGEAPIAKDLVKAEYFYKKAFDIDGRARLELADTYLAKNPLTLEDAKKAYELLKGGLTELVELKHYAAYLKLNYLFTAAETNDIKHNACRNAILREFGIDSAKDTDLALLKYAEAKSPLFAAMMPNLDDESKRSFYKDAQAEYPGEAAFGLSFISGNHYEELKMAAEGGIVPAQAMLCWVDTGNEAHWCEMLAKGGFAKYQYMMGEMSTDDIQAQQWYRLAAKQGDVQAMMRLGASYEKVEDWYSAFDWYRQAFKKVPNEDSHRAYTRTLDMIYQAESQLP